METNITIPAELYKRLVDEIMDCGFEPDDKYDTCCDLDEIEIGEYTVSLRVTFYLNYVDESFSHAFGVEEGHHYEICDIKSIENMKVWHYDEATDKETELSGQFDYGLFEQALRE